MDCRLEPAPPGLRLPVGGDVPAAFIAGWRRLAEARSSGRLRRTGPKAHVGGSSGSRPGRSQLRWQERDRRLEPAPTGLDLLVGGDVPAGWIAGWSRLLQGWTCWSEVMYPGRGESAGAGFQDHDQAVESEGRARSPM